LSYIFFKSKLSATNLSANKKAKKHGLNRCSNIINQCRQNLLTGSETTAGTREVAAADAAATDSAKLTVASFRKKPNLFRRTLIALDHWRRVVVVATAFCRPVATTTVKKAFIENTSFIHNPLKLIQLLPSLSSQKVITNYYLLVSIIR
jgi:hypothetical protein